MPFTPFHFGPGLLLKGLAPKQLSWTSFAAAQVVIDCETLFHLARHEYPIHRELHTFIGATLAGLATTCLLLGVRRIAPGVVRQSARWKSVLRSEISHRGILVGGVIGGASHPLLDGLMHPDIRPFAPWTDANPLLGMVELSTLHIVCVLAGIAGVGLMWMRLHRECRLVDKALP